MRRAERPEPEAARPPGCQTFRVAEASPTLRHLAAGLLALACLAACGRAEHEARALPPAEYAGASRCAGCHAPEAEAWRGSDHARAMQVPSKATVLGDFADVRFEHFGVTSRFFHRGDGYWVETEGADGKFAEFEIAWTFGVRPLQQYLIRFPKDHVQALGIAWDSRPREQGGQRWFSLHPHERLPPTDELHWTKPSERWNTQCAECHSTNVRRGYDLAHDSYDTSFSEIDVACEACHGAGARHVEWAQAVRRGERWALGARPLEWSRALARPPVPAARRPPSRETPGVPAPRATSGWAAFEAAESWCLPARALRSRHGSCKSNASIRGVHLMHDLRFRRLRRLLQGVRSPERQHLRAIRARDATTRALTNSGSGLDTGGAAQRPLPGDCRVGDWMDPWRDRVPRMRGLLAHGTSVEIETRASTTGSRIDPGWPVEPGCREAQGEWAATSPGGPHSGSVSASIDTKEGSSMSTAIRRAGAVAITILGLVLASSAAAPAEQPAQPPDATLKLTGGTAAIGLGYTWGGGVLTYKGKEYNFKISGLSTTAVGASSIDAVGDVYHLAKLEDFDGHYAGVTTAAAVGILLKAGPSGINIELQP